jgi:hypothetical protein
LFFRREKSRDGSRIDWSRNAPDRCMASTVIISPLSLPLSLLMQQQQQQQQTLFI